MKKLVMLMLSVSTVCAAERGQDGTRDQNDLLPKEKAVMAAHMAAFDQEAADKHDDALPVQNEIEHKKNETVILELQAIRSDLTFAEQAIKYAQEAKKFGERLVSDVQGNPNSHVIAALAGGVVGIFITKRFLSLGRLHRKADKILKILENGGSSSAAKDSRKSLIIQQ